VEAAASQVKHLVLAEGAASVEGRASKIAPKNSEAQLAGFGLVYSSSITAGKGKLGFQDHLPSLHHLLG